MDRFEDLLLQRSDEYPTVLIVGATTARRPDWVKYADFPPMEADPKKEAKRQASLQEAEMAAAYTPYQAYVTELAVISHDLQTAGQPRKLVEIFTGPADGPASAASQFASFFAEQLPPQVLVFGFNIRNVLRTVAADVSRTRQVYPAVPLLPLSLWYHPTFSAPCAYDPVDILLHASTHKNMDAAQLAAFYNLPLPRPGSAAAAAVFASQLCLAGGLLPRASHKAWAELIAELQAKSQHIAAVK